MNQPYYYQSEGEKRSMSGVWWFIIMVVAVLWFWKSLPLFQ